MIALGVAVGRFMDACHQNLISIRSAVADAVTAADADALAAIDLEQGWPA